MKKTAPLFLLMMLFLFGFGGCGKDDRRPPDHLHLAFWRWYGNTAMFDWASPQPVKELWLKCSEVGSTEYLNGIRLSTTDFWDNPTNFGRFKISMKPNTTYDCEIVTFGGFLFKDGTKEIVGSYKGEMRSEVVRLQTGPSND